MLMTQIERRATQTIQDFAKGLIRGGLIDRLTDRTFVTTVTTAVTGIVGTKALWLTAGIDPATRINATVVTFGLVAAVVASWNHSEKQKDAAVGVAAVQAQANLQAVVANQSTASTPEITEGQ